MRVKFRFLCVDMAAYSGVQEVDVEDGATVELAIAAHAKLNNIEDTLSKLSDTMFMVGKDPARRDTVLNDQDEVYVMRILHGG